MYRVETVIASPMGEVFRPLKDAAYRSIGESVHRFGAERRKMDIGDTIVIVSETGSRREIIRCTKS